jgi:hypothetical protein
MCRAYLLQSATQTLMTQAMAPNYRIPLATKLLLLAVQRLGFWMRLPTSLLRAVLLEALQLR